MRYWTLTASLLFGWILAAAWLVPEIIEGAYYGRSIDLVNGIISGRGEHPLDEYLRT